MRSLPAATLLSVLLLVPALAGCGGGKPTAADEKQYQQQLAYASCMRDNGYDMKDPARPRSDGSVEAEAAVPAIGSNPVYDRAAEKCKDKLPVGEAGDSVQLTAAERAKALKFSQCMRDNGIADYPDPDSAGNVTQPLPDQQDPAYAGKKALLEAAAKKCGGGAVPGTGPSK
jgi:hypothetical protein